MAAATWEEIGRQKREAIAALLPKRWRLQNIPSAEEAPNAITVVQSALSNNELRITEKSATQLLQLLATGELSAVEVFEAFAHRATIAHQLTNCLSEVLFEDARAQAQQLDEYTKTHGKPIGPLHGLPISLKDQFRVKGAETSLGYISWLGKVETEESESWLVSRLRELGAVIYVKTNVPTSLMAIETNNNIIGYTTNAHNRLLSSGGSSGGEAALLALRGSPLGLGSDVGASIRLPAAFNGIVGLKPSNSRLPYLRIANSMLGQTLVPSSIGPMGTSLPDLRLLMRTIIALQPWKHDPNVVPLAWRNEEEEKIQQKIAAKKLVIGVMRSDGIVRPHPPILRVMDEAAEVLRGRGLKIIAWEPPVQHSEGFDILWKTFTSDAGQSIYTPLLTSPTPEPPIPELASVYGPSFPNHLTPLTLPETWSLETRRQAFAAQYAAYWNATGVDVLLSPVAPSTSHERGKGRYPGYTGIWNVLDYAAVTIRSGRRVDKSKDLPCSQDVEFLNGIDEEVGKQWNPELFHDMPIGLQVIARRFEEEKVLAAAEEVERVLLG